MKPAHRATVAVMAEATTMHEKVMTEEKLRERLRWKPNGSILNDTVKVT